MWFLARTGKDERLKIGESNRGFFICQEDNAIIIAESARRISHNYVFPHIRESICLNRAP
jgi:hypothetical protein